MATPPRLFPHRPAARADASPSLTPAASRIAAAAERAGVTGAQIGERLTMRVGELDFEAVLPPAALAKLDHLDSLRRVAWALAAGMFPAEEAHQITDQVMTDSNRLAQLRSQWSGSAADEIERLEAKIARMRTERDRRQAAKDRAAEHARPIGLLHESIKKWIQRQYSNGAVFTAYEGPAPKMRKAERAVEAVERVRDELSDLHAAIVRMHRAPRPLSEATALLERYIDALIQRGVPDLFEAIERNSVEMVHRQDGTYGWLQGERPIRWPTATINFGSFEMAATAGRGTIPDAIALMAWLQPDLFRTRIMEELAKRADEKHAIAEADRTAMLTDLKVKILQAERDEEALIEMAEADHQQVVRRPSALPPAVLGLAADPETAVTIEV